MKEKKPQKQLLQFVLLSLLSVVSVLVMSNESFAAMDCGSCHGNGINPATGQLIVSTDIRPLDTLPGSLSSYRNITTGAVKGSHSAHLPAATINQADCNQCHNNTGYTSSHRTGVIQIGNANLSYNKGAGAITFTNQTSIPTLGSCTVLCHSASTAAVATPVWGSTSDCSSCHAQSATTGAHGQHLNATVAAAIPGGLSCGNCHTGATATLYNSTQHNDNNIDVAAGYSINNFAKHAYPYTYTATCTTTCHSVSTVAVVTPSWGAVSSCNMCHSSSPITGAHTSHTAAAVGCVTCHTSNGALGHVNGTIDVAQGYPAGVAKHVTTGYVFTSTCTTVCHSTTNVAIATPTWGAQSTCGSCHGAPPVTGDHTKHLAIASVNCGLCHIGATATSYVSTQHFDNNIDVAQGYPASVAKHAAGTFSGTCSTTCHSTSLTPVITPTWGAAASTTCGSCHAAPPATGDHTKHLAVAAVNCGSCHTNATATTYVSTRHYDNNIDVSQSYPAVVVKHAAGTYSGNCTTLCHSSTLTAVATPTWGATPSSTCGFCHAATPPTGDHTKHLAVASVSCASCHLNATATTYASTQHFDGTIDVGVPGYSATNVAKHAAGAYTGNCTTTCHSSTNVAVATPTWGSTPSSTCGFCHAATPPTGDHTKHLAVASVTCASCHLNATATTYVSTQHFDGNIDVGVPGYSATTVTKHATGAYTGNCTTTCHSASLTAVATPTWGSTPSSTCGFCHVASPATGDHTKHLAVASVTCGSCHAGATATTYVSTQHFDGNIDVSAAGYSNNNAAKHVAGTYAGNCTTTCHSATTAAVATPTWGATPSSTCGFCHAAAPTTGTHNAHLNGTSFVAMSCGACHTGASASNGGVSHLNGFINVSTALVDGKILGGSNYTASNPKRAAGTTVFTSGGNCSTAYCHGGTLHAGTTALKVPTWGGTLTGCNTCHGTPPLTPGHITTGTNYVAATSCSTCHDTAGTNGTSIAKPIQHVNGIIDGGLCDSCHGYPPVQTLGTFGHLNNYTGAKMQNYSGGGGVHTVAGHLPANIKPSAAFGIPGQAALGCITCHPATSHNGGAGAFLTAQVQIVVDGQYRFDKNRAIVYSGKQVGTTNKTSGTCSNVACHYQKSPIWSTQTYTKGGH